MTHVPEVVASPAPIRLLLSQVPSMLCDLLMNAFRQISDIEPAKADLEEGLFPSASMQSGFDVVLLGTSANARDGRIGSNIRALLLAHRDAKIIVLNDRPNYEETVAVFREGARGLFTIADLQFELLCRCVRCVHQGEIWASNDVTSHLVASLSTSRTTVVTDSLGNRILTRREQQVLGLLADGLSNSGLALELGISEHTVKNHLFRIYDKLGVSNRMEAVLYALAKPQVPDHPAPPKETLPASSMAGTIRKIQNGHARRPASIGVDAAPRAS